MPNRQNIYYIITGTSKKNFTKQTHPFGLTKSAKLVIANVNNSFKQCNGSVVIPNGPVNSEVNLSMYRDDD
jgi:hypothetical protein